MQSWAFFKCSGLNGVTTDIVIVLIRFEGTRRSSSYILLVQSRRAAYLKKVMSQILGRWPRNSKGMCSNTSEGQTAKAKFGKVDQSRRLPKLVQGHVML